MCVKCVVPFKTKNGYHSKAQGVGSFASTALSVWLTSTVTDTNSKEMATHESTQILYAIVAKICQHIIIIDQLWV